MSLIKNFRIFSIGFLLFHSADLFAAVTISSVENASVVEGTGTSSVTVYGGMAGDPARCDYGSGTSSTSVCNNCRSLNTDVLQGGDTNLQVCNDRRINPVLKLRITLTSDSTAGKPVITSNDGTSSLTLSTSTTSVSAGTTSTIEILWQTVCNQLQSANSETATSDCIPANGQVKGSLRVGFSADGTNDTLNDSTDDYRTVSFTVRNVLGNDPTSGTAPYQSLADYCDNNPQGICYFEIGPGDNKVAVKALRAASGSGFPSGPNTTFKSVRFLFDERGVDYINLGSDHVDLPVTGSSVSTFSVNPRRIEGLTNDQSYYFTSAVVDSAGNVGYYMSATQGCDESSTGPDAGIQTCRSASPSQVVGVLANTNCFIATAAYGGRDSNGTFAPQVEILRDFRDQILLNSQIGRNFVRAYYAVSPALALAIVDSPNIRKAVRIGLAPFVNLASLSLKYGFAETLAAIFALLTGSILLAFLVFRSARKTRLLQKYFTVIGICFAVSIQAIATSDVESNAIDAEVDAALQKATANEKPPAAEYPFPQTQPPPESQPTQQTATTEPAVTPIPERSKAIQKPLSINEEGEYYYGESKQNDFKDYGDPNPVVPLKVKGLESPASVSTEGEYFYASKKPPVAGSAGIKLGVTQPFDIKNSENGLSFKDYYGSDFVPTLLAQYEWHLTDKVGRIGILFETGVASRQAPGRFRRTDMSSLVPDEQFTFIVVPLQAGLIYRFQFAGAQWIVPYAIGGGGYSGVAEFRDDGKSPIFGGTFTFYGGGGFNFLMDWFDRHAVAQLEQDYGITHVWASLEYRQTFSVKSDLNLTSGFGNLGFSFDY